MEPLHFSPLVSGALEYGAIFCLSLGLDASLSAFLERRARRRVPIVPDPLDRLLYRWDARNSFSIRDLLNGGLVILGRPGSGKTSSSGRAIGKAILDIPGSGGLILSSSPTDLEMWRRLFAAAGRSDDLILFGPGHPHRFNVIDFLRKLGQDSRQIAKAIITIGESLDNDDARSGGGDTDKFWPIQMKITIETAVEILRQAEGRVHLPSLHKFVITAAASGAELKSEEWRAKLHNLTFAKAHARAKTEIEANEYTRAWDRWMVQWPVLNERTRTSIEASVTGVLDVFCQGMVRWLVAEDTTITPEVMGWGKWIFADMSVGQHGSSGAFVMNALKYATQQYVTSRTPDRWENIICTFSDEAGKLVNSHDSTYATESRKFGGCTVLLAQSLASFHAAMPGERGRTQAELLLGCFATKIAHACDHNTAEWLSKLLGNEVKFKGSMPGGKPQEQGLFGGGEMGWSESIGPCLESREFMHGLKTGGRANGFQTEAYVLRSGEKFADGNSYLRVPFNQ